MDWADEHPTSHYLSWRLSVLDPNSLAPSLLFGAIAWKRHLCSKRPALRTGRHHDAEVPTQCLVGLTCSAFQLLDQEVRLLNILLHPGTFPTPSLWIQKSLLKASLCLNTETSMEVSGETEIGGSLKSICLLRDATWILALPCCSLLQPLFTNMEHLGSQ